MVWYSHLLKNFPQFVVIHTVKGFGIVNKAEVDVFLELACFFDDPTEINPEYSLEKLTLKLKLQYFGHLMQTDDSLEKSLTLRKSRAEEEGVRGQDGWTHHQRNEHELGQTPGDGEEQGGLVCFRRLGN